MSDDILAALARIEREQTRLRVDVLARFERMDHRLDAINDENTVLAGSLRRIDVTLGTLNETFETFRQMFRRANARLDRLEEPPAEDAP